MIDMVKAEKMEKIIAKVKYLNRNLICKKSKYNSES
jgi:hypothetical protein